METLKIFIGMDRRQPVAFQVLMHSLYKNSSSPLSITPLVLDQLPIKRRGLTDFTYSRYLVPHLCDFRGKALFLDSDTLVRCDITDLFNYPDFWLNAVSVVKNKLKFEWPSVMLFNCAHFDCRKLTPAYIDDVKTKPNAFDWTKLIGELPKEWNHLVLYDDPNPDAKLVHFTAGIPCWPETSECEFSNEWNRVAYESVSSVSWQELMGNSVHADKIHKLKN
jgi:hypothetical protein